MYPVVISQSPNRIVLIFWGLISNFTKDEYYKYNTINARSKTVAILPTFRQPLQSKNCLIPASEFFEAYKDTLSSPPYPWHYFVLINLEEMMVSPDARNLRVDTPSVIEPVQQVQKEKLID